MAIVSIHGCLFLIEIPAIVLVQLVIDGLFRIESVNIFELQIRGAHVYIIRRQFCNLNIDHPIDAMRLVREDMFRRHLYFSDFSRHTVGVGLRAQTGKSDAKGITKDISSGRPKIEPHHGSIRRSKKNKVVTGTTRSCKLLKLNRKSSAYRTTAFAKEPCPDKHFQLRSTVCFFEIV